MFRSEEDEGDETAEDAYRANIWEILFPRRMAMSTLKILWNWMREERLAQGEDNDKYWQRLHC